MNRGELASVALIVWVLAVLLSVPLPYRYLLIAAAVLTNAAKQRFFPAEKVNLMEPFVDVGSTADVPDPSSTLVEVDDRLIVLVHAAGHWYALDDVCTHDGGPLSEGPVDPAGRTIACPRHGAKFDLATGAALTMPATQPTVAHEVKIEGDRVLVRLNAG